MVCEAHLGCTGSLGRRGLDWPCDSWRLGSDLLPINAKRESVASEKVVSSNFMSLGNDIEPSGSLMEDKTYPFSFDHFQKPYESHYGQNAKLRYLVRVTIMRSFYSDIVKELDVGVYSYTKPDVVDSQINMDVIFFL